MSRISGFRSMSDLVQTIAFNPVEAWSSFVHPAVSLRTNLVRVWPHVAKRVMAWLAADIVESASTATGRSSIAVVTSPSYGGAGCSRPTWPTFFRKVR